MESKKGRKKAAGGRGSAGTGKMKMPERIVGKRPFLHQNPLMTSLAEIESAAKKLPPSEHRKLVLMLTTNLQTVAVRNDHAAGQRFGTDYLLVAPCGAPAMTSEFVKQLLEDSP
jgi:hypothetical protein